MKKKQFEHYKKLNEDKIPITRDENGETMDADFIYKKKKRIVPQMSSQPDWDLLELRLEKKLELGMIKPIYNMNGVLSPEVQIQEVRNRTDLGYKLMLAEKGLLDYMLAYE